MAGLKELRTRIESIKSTQKITSAMKMVAAARLRRSQELLGRSKTYYDGLKTIAGRLYKDLKDEEKATGIEMVYPLVMMKNPNKENYMLVAFSSDRGLCGSYNAYVLRETLRKIDALRKDGKNVKVLCIGKKIGDALKRRCPETVFEVMSGVAAKGPSYREIERIAEKLFDLYISGEFDVCEMIYTHFRSAISRELKCQQILPYILEIDENDPRYDDKYEEAFYEYDAPKERVFNDVAFMLVVADVFQALLNSQTSEHGARMTSMDNATRNAKDMISKLTLKYNRMRQTAITTELIEIISGAEAL